MQMAKSFYFQIKENKKVKLLETEYGYYRIVAKIVTDRTPLYGLRGSLPRSYDSSS